MYKTFVLLILLMGCGTKNPPPSNPFPEVPPVYLPIENIQEPYVDNTLNSMNEVLKKTISRYSVYSDSNHLKIIQMASRISASESTRQSYSWLESRNRILTYLNESAQNVIHVNYPQRASYEEIYILKEYYYNSISYLNRSGASERNIREYIVNASALLINELNNLNYKPRSNIKMDSTNPIKVTIIFEQDGKIIEKIEKTIQAPDEELSF